MSVPIITHSEITDTIYVVCGTNKYNVTEQVIRAMRETGRLEQQRPHGEWKYHKYDRDYECSICNTRYDAFDLPVKTWNFCPNCGARMEEEGEK